MSIKLKEHYGKGFSVTNFQYFRKFYQVYPERLAIQHPLGAKSIEIDSQSGISRPMGGESYIPNKLYPVGREFNKTQKSSPTGSQLQSYHKHYPEGSESEGALKTHPAGGESKKSKGFHPNLSWSHYRALMRVDKPKARDFYENEAAECGWTKRQLERQIRSLFYERLLISKDKKGLLLEVRKEKDNSVAPVDLLKDPYILEFLDLPESEKLYETDLESAILNNNKHFLLELGKGFAFVARQKRISTETKEFSIDLVFYNYHLKFFLLIDLKTGELTHQDVGQMDMYVRMFDDLQRGDDDNPTVGLILCTEKDRTIVKYSVLNENRQLFASKYMLYLPSEEELTRELERLSAITKPAGLHRATKKVQAGEEVE
ncbi:MAG: PDDEXK nuclease domain-containing protein [Candidatus Auribacterota bacterium]|nr:PDDEXK nuclease domain-containing protein [Candidatus Auribacterota bacterium]